MRALISVSDKTGIADFARGLESLGVEIISTGGTRKALEKAGIKARDIAEHTGFPEIMDGRLKTLHPKVHGGFLAVRDNPSHMREMEENGIGPIDILVANLYPFEKAVAERPEELENAVENIDIGGPAMVRSAAKNYRHVLVVTDPADYGKVLEELRQGAVSVKTRESLAVKAFRKVADYDAAIDSYLSGRLAGEDVLRLSFTGGRKLRYGENPHQSGKWFLDPASDFRITQLHGKEISYNNLVDISSAVSLAGEFEECFCAIIKHNNPCGAAVAKNPAEAFRKARETDPVSAFGGVICFNRELDLPAAEEIAKGFVEVIIAPSFSEDGLAELGKKQNTIVIRISGFPDLSREYECRKICGGMLMQDANSQRLERDGLKAVTKKHPTEGQVRAMLFGWRVLKHVKSNAVIFVSEDRTLAIGAGQMSRVDSVKLARMKARDAGVSLEDSVACSDAFFPFRDGVDEVAAAGASAIVQPGGSVKDQEAIQAANEHGMAMAFTGFRCFRH